MKVQNECGKIETFEKLALQQRLRIQVCQIIIVLIIKNDVEMRSNMPKNKSRWCCQEKKVEISYKVVEELAKLNQDTCQQEDEDYEEEEAKDSKKIQKLYCIDLICSRSACKSLQIIADLHIAKDAKNNNNNRYFVCVRTSANLEFGSCICRKNQQTLPRKKIVMVLTSSLETLDRLKIPYQAVSFITMAIIKPTKKKKKKDVVILAKYRHQHYGVATAIEKKWKAKKSLKNTHYDYQEKLPHQENRSIRVVQFNGGVLRNSVNTSANKKKKIMMMRRMMKIRKRIFKKKKKYSGRFSEFGYLLFTTASVDFVFPDCVELQFIGSNEQGRYRNDTNCSRQNV
ncbi:hypothetical protein RFI_17638 [Reticulomyxa filosa]|uniref:Uncharacterized protein n=1 Tax=Reticulomyxa filosa TaxID=46433 RepID=X6N0J2_RETFI|nr:hypothetical protein RFI_17638 [Reticulomyxa filosa]|eukprot:ETO19591.1 hypothetical protein RFI_17638 [Reticulomyxa filosa]